MPLTAGATQAGLSHACFYTNSRGTAVPLTSPHLILPPSFLGVGLQGFDQKGMDGAQLKFTWWCIGRRGRAWGKCLAESSSA